MINLWEHRRYKVAEYIKKHKISSIADFGCGSGKLITYLMEYFKCEDDMKLKFLLGVDVDMKELLYCAQNIKNFIDFKRKEYIECLEKRKPFIFKRKNWKFPLFNLNYPDIAVYYKNILDKCQNIKLIFSMREIELVASIEVIEHLKEDLIDSYFDSLLGFYNPKYLLITTPNREYNHHYKLKEGKLRHPDHKFEFIRSEFINICLDKAKFYNYDVLFDGVGKFDEVNGHPTQLAFFINKKENISYFSNLGDKLIFQIPQKDLICYISINKFILAEENFSIKIKKFIISLIQILYSLRPDQNEIDIKIECSQIFNFYKFRLSFKNLKEFKKFLRFIKKDLKKFGIKLVKDKLKMILK